MSSTSATRDAGRVLHLTNFESYQLLAELKRWHKKGKFTGFEMEFLKYLGKTPILYVQKEDFERLVEFLSSMNVNEEEKVQILNLLPRTVDELKPLLEDCGSRFCESDLERMASYIGDTLGGEGGEGEEEGDGTKS